jgi:osmotically inducible lipoprotein OsmB
MRTRTVASLTLAAVLLSGCAGLSPAEERTLTGGAGGAAGGALLGALAGDAGLGAALGGAAGAAGGFLYNKYNEEKQGAYEQGYLQGLRQGG